MAKKQKEEISWLASVAAAITIVLVVVGVGITAEITRGLSILVPAILCALAYVIKKTIRK